MSEELLKIINEILRKNDKEELLELDANLSLSDDLGFDSLDLALLTVIIEDKFKLDIFEMGIIDHIHEILTQLEGYTAS